jgi:hypothetical protein
MMLSTSREERPQNEHLMLSDFRVLIGFGC